MGRKGSLTLSRVIDIAICNENEEIDEERQSGD